MQLNYTNFKRNSKKKISNLIRKKLNYLTIYVYF